MRLADILEGMQIIAKYAGDDQYCVQAEHDELFCGSTDLPLTEEDKKRMKDLGWMDHDGSWSCFT